MYLMWENQLAKWCIHLKSILFFFNLRAKFTTRILAGNTKGFVLFHFLNMQVLTALLATVKMKHKIMMRFDIMAGIISPFKRLAEYNAANPLTFCFILLKRECQKFGNSFLKQRDVSHYRNQCNAVASWKPLII